MKSFIVLSTLLTIGAMSAACSSTPLSVGTDPPRTDGGDGQSDAPGGGARCTTDDDCGSTGLCGFLKSDACVATGTCFPRPQATCLVLEQACACDGTTYNIACSGLPDGYVPKPFLHINPCSDAGTGPEPDSGPAPTDCVTDTDCGGKRLCGYQVSDACVAKGTCFSDPGPNCNLVLPGCSCDGSFVNLACNGLPSGYAPKPVAHSGQCSDAGK